MAPALAQSQPLEQLLTVRDVAALCAVSPSTVYEWASLGKIPCFKLGGAVRFAPSTLEQWLAESSRGRALEMER